MTAPISSKPVSACCEAPTEEIYVEHIIDESNGAVAGGHEETRCTKCGEECDLASPPNNTQGEEKCHYCATGEPCIFDAKNPCPCKCHKSPDTTSTQPSETVKAWAIVNPEGKIICVNMMETLAWEEAQELKIEYKRVLEHEGFRCIQVVVSTDRNKYCPMHGEIPADADTTFCTCEPQPKPMPPEVEKRFLGHLEALDGLVQQQKEPKYAYWYEYNALHKLVDALQEKVAALEKRL